MEAKTAIRSVLLDRRSVRPLHRRVLRARMRLVIEEALGSVERIEVDPRDPVAHRGFVSLEDDLLVRLESPLLHQEVPPRLAHLPEAVPRVDTRCFAHAVSPFGAGRCAGASIGGSRATRSRSTPSTPSGLCARAARMKSLKSGCGAVGLLLNSGWNWPPRNQGWSASSIISTNFRSGDMPQKIIPPSRSFGSSSWFTS